MPLMYSSFLGKPKPAQGGGVTEFPKVGESTFTVAAGGGTETKTLPDDLGGGFQEGDVVLVIRIQFGGLSSIVTSGYTTHISRSTQVSAMMDYKQFGASPDSEVEIAQHTTVKQAGIIQIWRGADATTPIKPANYEDAWTGGSSGMPDAPSYTTTVNGAKVFAVGFLDDDDVAASVTAPAGFGDLVAADSGQGLTTNGTTVMVASMTQETAGAVDPAAFGGTGSDVWQALTFELLPAA